MARAPAKRGRRSPDDIAKAKALKEHTARRHAHFEACLGGWLSTTFERDKSVLAISSGGVAIVFAVLSQAKSAPAWLLSIYIGAAIAFFSALILVTVIFSLNKRIFEKIIADEEPPSYAALDWTLIVVFCLGMGLLLAGGIGQAFVLSTSNSLGDSNGALAPAFRLTDSTPRVSGERHRVQSVGTAETGGKNAPEADPRIQEKGGLKNGREQGSPATRD